MRALEAEQHARGVNSNNGSLRNAHDPPPIHSPNRLSARQGPHHRWLYPPRRWVIASSVLAAVVVLAVELASGTGPNPRGHPSRAVASGTTHASGLIQAAMNRFLAVEHAADRTLKPKRPRSTRTPRTGRPHPRQPPRRISTSLAASPSPSTTSSTTGTSGAVDIAQHASPSTSSRSSNSTSSGSSQPPPATQPHSAPSSSSGSSSSTPSKAALKSLVTGAGTCSCQ